MAHVRKMMMMMIGHGSLVLLALLLSIGLGSCKRSADGSAETTINGAGATFP